QGEFTRLHQAPAADRGLCSGRSTEHVPTADRQPTPCPRTDRSAALSPGASFQFLLSRTSRRVHARRVCADLRTELVASWRTRARRAVALGAPLDDEPGAGAQPDGTCEDRVRSGRWDERVWDEVPG